MSVFALRVALTTEAFDSALKFYKDGLGLDPGELWTSNGGQGQMFRAGRGTLELFDPGYGTAVDQIEACERVSGQIRFAFEVADVEQAMQQVLKYGATLVHEPVITPWNDRNVPLQYRVCQAWCFTTPNYFLEET